MSQQIAIHFSEDAGFAAMPEEAPQSFHDYDYGTLLPGFMSEVENLLATLGLPGLASFACDEEAYEDATDLEEELEEALEEDAEEDAAALRNEISSLVPHHSPGDLLRIIRPLIAHLVDHPTTFDRPGEDPAASESILLPDGTVAEGPDGMTSTQSVFCDLKAFELVLEAAQRDGRSVFLVDM